MLRLLMVFLLFAWPLQAAEPLRWHGGNDLNEAGRLLHELLLPEPAAFASLSLAERDAWLGREWRRVLAERARFAQYRLPPERGEAGFNQALAGDELVAYLRRQQPDYPGYRQLRQHYLALAQVNHHTPLPPGAEVRPGERDAAIPALRQRLLELGHALPPPRGRADALDASLSEVLKSLQQAHGLAATGRLNDDTRALLSRSPAEVRAELRHNLRRWLLLPPAAPERYVLVNIPAYRLTLMQNQRPELEMKVIVGRPDWPTPALATHIDGLKLNPDWTPTANIIREDLLPAQRRDSGFLARNGFSVWLPGEGEGQDPGTIDWLQPPAGIRLVQAPGPNNALGRLKFEMPNRFDVYLHDTPDKRPFNEAERALSHGCVRLAEPERLATGLGWPLPPGSQTRILPAVGRVPLYLVYFTAWVEQGHLVFTRDIYGKNG
ncbi:L,D-transpeptidase family protein [Zobellella iuensis]|uniref:L,D-transpeptidase family protein n=1 Tax=Zobellella iuensis TaxID=2803811 RepID=A0ABS1QVH6_9GAMM|nr:L,D-transpeptidase family protein [Zobellella iuensis]MBL1378451.1 L,D-transpeptidase family protein [Zobellella iuensis]